MEAVELLTLGMAFVFLVAIFGPRGKTRTRPRDRRTIKVSDAATARRALIDNGNAFSNRPMPPFPAGRAVTHSISSAPYGPFWRALRSNLAADILHRSRLGVLAPLERDAAEALVSNLSAQAVAGNDGVVVPRNTLHGAIFALIARLCFGDDVDGIDLGAMLETQREFLESFAVVRDGSERSWLARLLHRRRNAGIFDRVDEVFVPAAASRRLNTATAASDRTSTRCSSSKSLITKTTSVAGARSPTKRWRSSPGSSLVGALLVS
ncbi:unnamed protein product [Urochloa humidicola]